MNELEKECIKEVVATYKKETKVLSITSFVFRNRLAAAAVILVLMLPLSYMLFQNLSSSKSDQLFAANADHYTAIQMNTRSGTGDAPDPFQDVKDKGIVSYNEKKYDEALKHLKEYYSKTDEKHKTT